MNAAERLARDMKAVRLFIAGKSFRAIQEACGYNTLAACHKAVRREMQKSERRDLLRDQAFDVYVERLEALWAAHYPRAVAGDTRSAEHCRRVLQQEARLFGLEPGAGTRVPGGEPPDPDGNEDDESTEGSGDATGDNVSDLDEWRSRQNA
ncbi:hypothetical protein [Mycobacteroides abscessus]